MNSSQPRNKRKAFYRRCAAGEKRAKQRELEASGDAVVPTRLSRNLETGMTGIFITANHRDDKDALMESYRILNEAHERLNPTSTTTEPQETDPRNESDDDDDIAATLRQELTESKASKFLFYAVKSSVSNSQFILNLSEKSSSSELVHEVFRNVLHTGKACSRRVLRFQPVVATCRPDVADLKAIVKSAMRNFLSISSPSEEEKQPPLCSQCPSAPSQRAAFLTPLEENSDESKIKKRGFTVQFRSRNCDRLGKADAVSAVIIGMQDVAPDWKPVCAGADLVISVDVLCNVLCLSLLEKFIEFSKYNLQQLSPCT